MSDEGATPSVPTNNTVSLTGKPTHCIVEILVRLQSRRGFLEGENMENNRNEYRGIYKAHSAGWDKLVDPLIDLVLDAGGTVDQVKEKFGGLRFYFGGLNAIDWERIDPLVTKAESESYHICEQCGEPGKLRQTGWIQTLCDKHMDEYIQWKNAQETDGPDEEEV